MGTTRPNKAHVDRWQRQIVDRLEDLPRQHAALEAAMAFFGGDFDLAQFKRAYDTTTDIEAYNRVQAVERALGRVQNYVAELSSAGVKLADLPPPSGAGESEAVRAFAALRQAGVIKANLCKRLIRAQKARVGIEHSYVMVPAGSVHTAAELIRDSSLEFIAVYREWIDEYL